MGKLADLWTRFVWRICFPTEPCPDYILGAEPKPKVTNEVEALVELVIGDIDLHPNDWQFVSSDHIKNESLSINIVRKQQGYGSRLSKVYSYKINATVINLDQWTKIVTKFNNRFVPETLEKLLARRNQIDGGELKREVKRNDLVDPFQEDQVEKLNQVLLSLEDKGSKVYTTTPQQTNTTSISKMERGLRYVENQYLGETAEKHGWTSARPFGKHLGNLSLTKVAVLERILEKL